MWLLTGFNFMRTAFSRFDCPGMINVRPTYLFFSRPSIYGMPDSAEYPVANAVPESGTGETRSASVGIFPKRAPILLLASYTNTPSITESGRAVYTYSKIQCALCSAFANCTDSKASLVKIRSSPASTSRISSAPVMSKATLSETTR